MSRTCHRTFLDSFEVRLELNKRFTINDSFYRGVLLKSLRVRLKSRTDSGEFFSGELIKFFVYRKET